jgi:hypothetical protein
MRVRHRRLWVRLIWVIAGILFLTIPIGFFFAADGAQLQGDWLGGLYAAFVELLGERGARWVFCGLWLIFNIALFWRFVLSKSRYEPGDPVDLDD